MFFPLHCKKNSGNFLRFLGERKFESVSLGLRLIKIKKANFDLSKMLLRSRCYSLACRSLSNRIGVASTANASQFPRTLGLNSTRAPPFTSLHPPPPPSHFICPVSHFIVPPLIVSVRHCEFSPYIGKLGYADATFTKHKPNEKDAPVTSPLLLI